MAKTDRKQRDEAYAREIADRLSRLKPELWSEAHWCARAKVSPSFFSNLRGTPTKGPAVPSVTRLAEVLDAIGVSLSEFFLPEACGKVGRLPSAQALERRLSQALVELPKKPADRLPYLLDIVRGVLELPDNQQPNLADDQSAKAVARAEGAPLHAATR